MIHTPGVYEFTDLADAPNSFLGSALKVVSVNAGETALVFTTGGGGGGGGTWGSITGTLSSQTDLQTALDAKQPLDSDLTTLASLTATTDNFIIAVASAWASRTPAQAKTTLALVKADVGLGNVDNTTDANKPVSTATQTALDNKQPLDSDLTAIAALVATTDNFIQSKASAWTSRTVAQVKTDLGLTGTNSGDQTSIVGITGTLAEFNTALTGADFATGGGTVTGTSSGTNTGDNAVNTLYSSLVSNATHTGDAEGATALVVKRINGVALSGLATGILKNTTTTGVPSIATGADLPVMTATVGGAVPTPPNNTTTFLRGDGTFAAPPGGGSSVSGQATVDFGAVTTENSIGRVTVATASALTASIISVTPSGAATADHDTDDYQWDNISGYVSNIINGISFDIIGVAPNGTWGDYKFNYVIN